MLVFSLSNTYQCQAKRIVIWLKNQSLRNYFNKHREQVFVTMFVVSVYSFLICKFLLNLGNLFRYLVKLVESF